MCEVTSDLGPGNAGDREFWQLVFAEKPDPVCIYVG